MQYKIGASNPVRSFSVTMWWVAALGLAVETIVVAKTIRRRFLQPPGRLTHSGRRWRLHLPEGWPWQDAFTSALRRLRALPLLA